MQLKWNVRGERAGYVELASRNAQLTLATELNSRNAQHARSDALREMLGLPSRSSVSSVLISATPWARHRSLVRGVRRRRPGARAVPPLQHQRHRAGRRLRRHAPGHRPPFPPRSGRAGRAAGRAADRRWRGQLAQAQAALADLGVEGVLLVGVARAWSAVPATKRW